MEYREFKDKKVSLLGFGCMRFPTIDGEIDEAEAEKLIDYAYRNGVNYFDTAYIYHGGKSETFIGEALKKYPRDSYFLADKMPLWLAESEEDLERIFSEQLSRCGVEYFDFYLLHSMNAENCALMEKYRALDFLNRKKACGQIRYVGFSFHDVPAVLEKCADVYPWDFAQIQYNYLDYDMQNAKLQYEILAKRSIPVVVMEPVRGGMLANLSAEAEAVLKSAQPNSSVASWAMRFAATPAGMLTVLSGMSDFAQVKDNVSTFADFKPITDADKKILDEALDDFRNRISIPCTGCGYCEGCPAGVDIPQIFALYNRHMISKDNNNYRMAYRKLDDKIKASNCIFCNNCKKHCPQGIDIPAQLKRIHDLTK